MCEWHGSKPLVFRAFWIYTLPNLCPHWIQGLCFIVAPSLTHLSHRKPTSARTTHDSCMLKTAAKWMHGISCAISIPSDSLLLCSCLSHWHWWVVILQIAYWHQKLSYIAFIYMFTISEIAFSINSIIIRSVFCSVNQFSAKPTICEKSDKILCQLHVK